MFKTYGRLRIFMVKRGTDSRIKFYATNNLKMTISTFCTIWKGHWGIETFHNYSKCFFGLENSYSGKKNTNITHWRIVILLYLLFCHFKRKYAKIYCNLTIHNLWELYCFEYDFYRSRERYLFDKKRKELKRKILRM